MAINYGTRSRLVQAGGLIPVILKAGINSAPTGAVQNSSVTLPAKAVVLGAWIDVRVAEVTGTTKTLDVGPSSDPDGYLDGIDVSSTGLKKGTLDSGGQTLGVLLHVDESGAGVLVPEGDLTGSGEVLQFDAGSGDWVEFRGDIYVLVLNLS